MPDYSNNVTDKNMAGLLDALKMEQAANKSFGDNALKQQEINKPGELAQQKAQLGQQEQDRNVATLKGLLTNVKPGEKMNFKVGDVSGGQSEENPMKYLFRSQQQGAHALSHAYDTYSKGLPDLNKAASAASEGLNAVSDPTQSGSLGIVRSQMLRSMGMNRYNEKEAAQSMPPALYQQAKQLFAGVSNWDSNTPSQDDVNPMNAMQKQAANNFFRGSLQTVKERHRLLRQTALGSYQNSGFFDPQQGQQFSASVGKDFDDYLDKIMAPKPGTVPQNYNSPPAGTAVQQPQQQQQSGLSKFFSAVNPFSGNHAAQTTPQAQSPQDPGMSRYQELLKKSQQPQSN